MSGFVSGKGAFIQDDRGRRRVDWVMGHGALLLGHSHPALVAALGEQAGRGVLLPGRSRLEEEVEAGLLGLFPHHQAVAFGKNGSDACTAAVRLARAVTGREIVLHYGYHGFHDGFVASDASVRGIPACLGALIHHIAYGDLDGLRGLFAGHGSKIAALIMEPFRESPPAPDFLAGARALCSEHGALFILDEIVTGFRVAPGGAQQLYSVQADLSCLAKALSGGMPLSALLGPRVWIQRLEALRFGMTTRAERLSLAAAAASLPLLADPALAPRAAAAGERLRACLHAQAERLGIEAFAEGHPAMMRIRFEQREDMTPEELLAVFLDACLDAGLWSNGTLLPSAAHDEQALELSTRAVRAALERVVERAREARPWSS